jgi:hypothetical protein
VHIDRFDRTPIPFAAFFPVYRAIGLLILLVWLW